MKNVSCTLTVYFEPPFWVGVFERIFDSELSVAKVTFGAEPKDVEIHAFVLKHYSDLSFSPSVGIEVTSKQKNPKRVLREAKKQVCNNGIGTKSQQALKLQQTQKRTAKKERAKASKEEFAAMLFACKQQKKKAKHRGH